MLSIENVKHVVFDFDGVIIDSERQKFSDLQDILNDYNYILHDSDFRIFIGKKRGQFLKELGVTNIDEIMKKVHEKDSANTNIKLVNGLKEFLIFLKNKNLKMHIATGSSKEFVISLLKKHKLTHYFSQIITGDEVRESKPDPRIYLEVRARLNNTKIIVLEDSPAGVESAKKAGLFVIGLGIDLGADIEFSTYEEIIKYLNSKI